jgi:hypothetical protein
METELAERRAFFEDAMASRAAIAEEYGTFIGALEEFLRRQRDEVAAIILASSGEAILVEEERNFREIIKQHETKIFADQIAEQMDLINVEVQTRIDIEESCGAEQSALDCTHEKAEQLEAVRRAFAQQLTRLCEEETALRQDILVEEAAEGQTLDRASRLVPQHNRGINRNSTSVDDASPLGGRASIVEDATNPKNQYRYLDSDDDSEHVTAASLKPVQSKMAPRGATRTPQPKATLFGSDSEGDVAPPAPSPPKKTVRKALSKKTKMFESDSD